MNTFLDETEQTIATEVFEPALEGRYIELFHTLVVKLGNTLPVKRTEIIRMEIY